MPGFLASLFAQSGPEKEAAAARMALEPTVEALGGEETQVLLRQVMTLARRRRCATEHLGGDIGMAVFLGEENLTAPVTNWYFGRGHTHKTVARVAQEDVTAIAQSLPVSNTLRRRILLTDFFSPGKLEDTYRYGEIDPYVFESTGGLISLRDTLFDRMGFAERVRAITSFDPEVQGHRHQIRYFRALLASYALAHMVYDKVEVGAEVSESAQLLLDDEVALARGWFSLAERAAGFDIEPMALAPDPSWLYSPSKVIESARLFDHYAMVSRNILRRQ